LALIFKTFHLSIQTRGIILRFNKYLSKLFFITEGFKSVLLKENIESDDLVALHVKYKKNLFTFRQAYGRLENARFFKNSTTRKLCNNILDNYYEIEYRLRNLAYTETKTTEIDDSQLLEAASSISLGSI
jgi:hypothetical protein